MTPPTPMPRRAGWLFFSTRGRIARGTAVLAAASVLGVFVALSTLLERAAGPLAPLVLYPVLYWALLAIAIKRAHDYGASGARLFLALIPLAGLLFLALELTFRSGTAAENAYGPRPKYHGLDYLVVKTPVTGPRGKQIVDDVTQVNPVEVMAVVTPTSVDEIQEVLRRSDGPISVGGGHFSMGGQTASPGSVHLDMRSLNQVLWLSPSQKRVRVQAGIRWCDVQRFLDAHGLAIQIMQTYANFTVGGALSVNAHGRYVGLGPLVLSVVSLDVLLADGSRVSASPTLNAEIFYGCVGGYGALGVVVEVELELAENTRVARVAQKLPRRDYLEHFRQKVRSDPKAIFHNADLYPPHYESLRSVTWVETDRYVTEPARLQQVQPSHRVYQYLAWAISESPLGKWRREWLIDPLLYLSKPVHWRNYEAGYDVAELEPQTRRETTYVLQEYFVPVARFDDFVPKMAEIFQRHDVNVLNVSVRHALKDPGTYLAWAAEEVFAFVVYYKQRTDSVARGKVEVWTRELIDAAIACGGRYYLPYQPHATPAQLHAAYPRAKELFALKDRLDPHYRFRNVLWDKYYAPERDARLAGATPVALTPRAQARSDIRAVMQDVTYRDKLYLFFQNVYHLVDEDDFHAVVRAAAEVHDDDEAIYRLVQEKLPGIRPALGAVTHALPALAKQKEELARETLLLFGERRKVNGYLEIGSIGRYLSALRGDVEFSGPLYVMNDQAPSNSPADIAERGGLAEAGKFLPLDYAPLPSVIEDASLDVVSCYIGLHHAPREKLDAFLASVARVLRPGGLFVLRDHDCDTAEMTRFVSVVHTVFNCGLDVSWATNQAELRFFLPLAETVATVERQGLKDTGARHKQPGDPTDNVLVAFTKA